MSERCALRGRVDDYRVAAPYARSTDVARSMGGSAMFEGFMVLLGGLLASLLPDRWAKRFAARFPSRRRGKHVSEEPSE